MKNIFTRFVLLKNLIPLLILAVALSPLSIQAATVVGTVKSSADTTIHISGAKVILIVAAVHVESTTTDSVGNYRLDSVAVGNAKSLQATKTGFSPTTSLNFNISTAQANSTITQNINLQLYGSISGTVRKSSDTTALANVLAVLTRGTSTVVLDSARSNSLGIFNFTNVAPGTPNYSITMSATNYLNSTSSNIAVASGGSAAVNVYLVLTVPGTIAGKVRKLTDTTFNIANAQVTLRRGSASAAVIDSALTDSLGRYTFHNVAPGTPNYWISASASGYISGSNTNVAVSNGGTITSNFGLGSPGTLTGTLTNTVTSDISVPITNALVLLRRGSDTASIIDSTRSNSQGVYTFHNVAPGTPNYWISAVTNIGTMTNANVTGTSGGTTVSNFNFVQTVAVFHPNTSNSESMHVIRVGDHLTLNVKSSQMIQTLEVQRVNGVLYETIRIPAGETRIILPASLAHMVGLLYRLK